MENRLKKGLGRGLSSLLGDTPEKFSKNKILNFAKKKNINTLDSTETIFELNLPQFTLALESEIRDWLVFRMGINKTLNYTSFNINKY